MSRISSRAGRHLRLFALLLGIGLALQGCTNDNGNSAVGNESSPQRDSAAESKAVESDRNEDGSKTVVQLFPQLSTSGADVLYGYVDAEGRSVIPASYDFASSFHEEGWAETYMNDELILIDKTGDDWFRLSGGYIGGTGEGRIIATNGSMHYLLDPVNKRMLLETKNLLFAPKDGMILFEETKKDGTIAYGYLDMNGQTVIPALYAWAESYNEGKAVVKTTEGTYMMIDQRGSSAAIFRGGWHEVSNYGEGLVVFRPEQGGLAGYAAEDGTIVVDAVYQFAEPFRNGLAVVMNYEEGWMRHGVIDKRGSVVIPLAYDSLDRIGDEWFVLGTIDEHGIYSYRLADGEGHMKDGVYRSVADFNGHLYVFDGNRTFFIGEDGNVDAKLPSFEGNARIITHDSYIEATSLGRLSIVGWDGAVIWKESRSAELPSGLTITERIVRDGAVRYFYYPEIHGLQDEGAEKALNERFRIEAEERLAAYRADEQDSAADAAWLAGTEVSGDFAYAGTFGRVLVMKLDGYEYYQGAAHGTPWKLFEHIDLDTGAVYGLTDLVTEEGLQELERRLREQAEAAGDSEDPWAENYDLEYWEGVTAEQSFYIDGGELVLYFHPYEIAPYAAGFPEFRFPLTELEPWIVQDGRFWQALNG